MSTSQISAFAPYNVLATQRIFGIDALRGITILMMIFVNEVAGVRGIPDWMKHVSADADAMTFVDVVFPAFLFIVGMALPFAIAYRFSKGDSPLQVVGHVMMRTIGLLVFGFYMVNAEGGYNESAMPISIALWSLLFYISAILVWNTYRSINKNIKYALRGLGLVGLAALALMYRGDDGVSGMTPQWWGILGLIGWAYLAGSLIYLVTRGSLPAVLGFIPVCIGLYALQLIESDHIIITWLSQQRGHATHTAIVLCGTVCSLIFFNHKVERSLAQRVVFAGAFAFIIVIVALALRPLFTISKIYATPSWGLFSAAICIALFAFIYWLIDVKKAKRWVEYIQPAAENPLLVYIIPPIIYAFMVLTGLRFPGIFYQGVTGILWAIVYTAIVLAITRLLIHFKIKLQL